MTTTQANGSGGDGLKITMVGAGGMSFGPTMVNDVVRTAGLRGARLVLHDVNAERLDRAYRFAAKLNAAGAHRSCSIGQSIRPPPLRAPTSCWPAPSLTASSTGVRTTRCPTGTAPVRSPARTVVRGGVPLAALDHEHAGYLR
ncbi:MAG: hypothetical protein IPH29_12480 [Candidatus Microthrix sp.]|nr:hypothetical protein [Candidatus Microthrix sp.]